ncbi:hypothetical protein [Ornithinimicrobium avium]|uniref:Uncharacterized protein n=1 Tax=Ornithinimicrobium avium TaxID=2283195 RepID=A0A345NQ75_9MICO|nr:hypothetical protein [Ornithinimicrobium avium]AXH97183.1 hypothetical protein DV701_14610 [Ornithinimicrobium avium]
MRTTRTLLNGDVLVLDVPDAETMPAPAAIGVLARDGLELEITTGGPGHLEHYLSVSGTRLTGEVQLRHGATLRHGRHGDDPARGLVFALRTGDHEIYGTTVPGMDLEGLTSFLSHVEVATGPAGPVLTPAAPVGWSEHRTHDVAQVVRVVGGARILLDVRRTRNGLTRPSGPGLDVRGGRLSRSADDERVHYAVLETPAFLVYGIPADEEHVDAAATTLSTVTAELG